MSVFSLQIALIYTCARLAINICQVYIPLYLTESLKLKKVGNRLLFLDLGLAPPPPYHLENPGCAVVYYMDFIKINVIMESWIVFNFHREKLQMDYVLIHLLLLYLLTDVHSDNSADVHWRRVSRHHSNQEIWFPSW